MFRCIIFSLICCLHKIFKQYKCVKSKYLYLYLLLLVKHYAKITYSGIYKPEH